MKLVALVALLALSSIACSAGEPARPGAAVVDESNAAGGHGGSPAGDSTQNDSSPTAPTNPSQLPKPSAPAAPVFKTSGEQVAAGQQTFESVCTRCHGSDGSGGRGPRLIGRSDGALESFTNAEDVAAYVASNMPVSTKGEAYAVVAYLMSANNVALDEKILDEASAPSIELR